MTIAEALKQERIHLGLTQDEMIQGIIHKSHYSKIERGIEGISAESLFKILFAHHIDVDQFLEQIKDDFLSEEDLIELKLENKLKSAFNGSNKEKIEECLQEVMKLSDSRIFKYRVVVAVAIVRNQLDRLGDEFKSTIIAEFNAKDNWVENIDMLRLFANCIPVFSTEQADNYISFLLKHYNEKVLYSEKYEDRIASICINYLYCWRNYGLKGNQVKNCLDYLLNLNNTNHFLFYKACGSFYKCLYEGNIAKAKEVKAMLISLGYEDRVTNWKE